MYNPNFYNSFPGNNFTFHMSNATVPPPPKPPPFFIHPRPVWSPETSDKEFVNHFESKITLKLPKRHKSFISISQIREQLQTIIISLNYIKNKETILSENINTLSEEEWSIELEEIEKSKTKINRTLAQINDSYLDVLRKLIAKRSAKRLRLKRVQLERKRDKKQRIKELEERSRKIDENLQKIKDDINKAKQEENDKRQADIVLKEVLRKKHDAKKCVVKLDALMKLRKARQNTAKGRGESVTENDANAFNANIDKLKSLWIQKLTIYEKEEAELRSQLNQDAKEVNESSKETEKEVMQNMSEWRVALFGGALPQRDFSGNIGSFVAVRSEWDQFISNEGSPIPVGWVLSPLKP